tara:strand:- start:419 stop:646 length:228 start_codon:yes stop_codon:yes gene_type:complete
MKKVIINPENPNGLYVDMTAEEIAAHEESMANSQAQIAAEEQAKQDKENLKASAKAKLIAGEKLTEEEANILVGV